MQEILCPHFGTCGGCRIQNLPYDQQLESKRELVLHAFSEIFPYIDPIVACEPPWRYRNKMEYSFSQSLAGERFLGLMQRGKRGRVVTLTECHLAPRWFEEALDRVRDWWEESGLDAYFPPANRGALRTLTLREGRRTGQRMAVLTISGEAKIDEESFAELLEVDTAIVRRQILAKKVATRFEESVLRGSGYITEKLWTPSGDPLHFRIGAGSFFQPNTEQAEKIYTLALEMAELEKGETLFDLYCGTGSIGMFASSYVGKVVGIELNAAAVADARENIALNGIENMEVVEGDSAQMLPENLRPTTLTLDPPRAGLGAKAIGKLVALEAKKIVYISCNPLSQAKDVEALVESGYEVLRIQPVDQFPHTPHIENIVALARKI